MKCLTAHCVVAEQHLQNTYDSGSRKKMLKGQNWEAKLRGPGAQPRDRGEWGVQIVDFSVILGFASRMEVEGEDGL